MGDEGGKLLVMKDAKEAWGKEGYGGLSRWVASQLVHVPDDDQIGIAQNLIMRQLGRRKWRQEPFSEEIAEGEGAYEIFAHLERAYKRNGGADGSHDWLVENWRRVPRGARENFMSVAFRLYFEERTERRSRR